MNIYTVLSAPHKSVIEVMLHEQYNFEPAEVSVHKTKCEVEELYGCELVYDVYAGWNGINHGRICITDGKCWCVVDIDHLL